MINDTFSTEDQKLVARMVARLTHQQDTLLKNHNHHVVEYALKIGSIFQLPQSKLELLKIAAQLHDVGKLLVGSTILNKPGKLDEQEFAIMKRHVLEGTLLIEHAEEYKQLSNEAKIIFSCFIFDVIGNHHLHYSAETGYGVSAGIGGTGINFFTRIVSVADAYDAMTSERPYKKSVAVQDAAAELERCSGRQFDPDITSVWAWHLSKQLTLQHYFPTLRNWLGCETAAG